MHFGHWIQIVLSGANMSTATKFYNEVVHRKVQPKNEKTH